MDKRIFALFIVVSLVVPLFSGCLEEDKTEPNEKPVVEISYPRNNMLVSNLVMISGTASDPDGDNDLVSIEVKVKNDDWEIADGTAKWSYNLNAFKLEDGSYQISVRAWDGKEYSDVKTITVQIDNPETVESDSHKWAIFIAAANFPKDNKSKLGNGGLYLAEEMTEYFIEELQYSTSNIIILFDDGWIRSDNGYGERIETLQERYHSYDITYGGATKQNVIDSLTYIMEESNKYRDSEVFIWIFNHGYGDENNTYTGGKILESSWIFLWDDAIRDKELGEILGPLKSQKACIIVDACFCGGFADKTILNLPTSLLLRSGIPQNGRIVIAGSSKFRKGYASTTEGPLFSLLWFEGLKTGQADGFKSGPLNLGRFAKLSIFRDNKVSVEEAFYYARYVLSTDESLKDFSSMEPQINDRYPHRGFLRSKREMFLGQD